MQNDFLEFMNNWKDEIMEISGIVVEVVERDYWIYAEIFDGNLKWIRCIPKRFDVEFGDYISMDTDCPGDALWAPAYDDDKIGKLLVTLIPFLTVDATGRIFENGEHVATMKREDSK